jgi:hypothetical protein
MLQPESAPGALGYSIINNQVPNRFFDYLKPVNAWGRFSDRL